MLKITVYVDLHKNITDQILRASTGLTSRLTLTFFYQTFKNFE